MNKKGLYIFLSAASFITVCLNGCKEQSKPAGIKPENTFSVNGSVRQMTIQPEIIDFPEHEGKAEFMSYCAMCHSLKYITMQPDFSRKTWDSEVTKMIAKYKAPIDSVVGKKIVDYLVAIKSKS